MKILKKSVIMVFALMVMLNVGAIPCFAKSVDLTKSQYWNNSGELKAKQTRFSGTTNKSNPRSVYFIAEYEDSEGFHYGTKKLVAAGAKCPTLDSHTFKSNKVWRLQLNPYGTNTRGCVASGEIWKRK